MVQQERDDMKKIELILLIPAYIIASTVAATILAGFIFMAHFIWSNPLYLIPAGAISGLLFGMISLVKNVKE